MSSLRPFAAVTRMLPALLALACSHAVDGTGPDTGDGETMGNGGASSNAGSTGASGSKTSGAGGASAAGGASTGMAGFPSGAGTSASGGKAGSPGTAGTTASGGKAGTPGSGGASSSTGGSTGTAGKGTAGTGTAGAPASGGMTGNAGNPGSAGTGSGTAGSGTAGSGTAGSSSGGCDTNWVFMGNDPNACDGHLGESCGWTAANEGQGYHCQTVSWGVGCEPGGGGCSGGSGGSSTGSAGSSTGTAGSSTGTGGSGSTGSGLASLLSKATFDAMFPNSHLAVYSYQGLLDAAAAFPAFGGAGTTDQQKREIAAFLANVAHETGELQYADEIAKDDYCQSSAGCPCEGGQQYFGRGALQLSWNYNYCAAGDALGYDLRKDPGQVSSNPKLIWLTGMWFWMTSTGAGNQTCHDGIASSGFGSTIKTINGGLECGGQNAGSAQDRVDHYKTFCGLLGVDPGSNFTC